MMSSIGGTNFMPPPPSNNTTDSKSNSSQSLSSDQQSLIEETLSNYDATDLSEQDAANIVETFAEAGINPSAEFAEALSASGFDAREIGSLANVGGQGGQAGGPPPPPPSGNNDDASVDLSSIVDYLDDLTSASSAEDSSSTSIAAQLAAQFGLSEGQSLINVTA